MCATNSNDILLARLAESLDSTAKMTQALLSDLRESEADFAAIKTELNILKENVTGLSKLIKDGNGTSSILTRTALIEQNIENIKKWIDNHIDVHQREKETISSIKQQLHEIDRRLSFVEEVIEDIKGQAEETGRITLASMNREIDFVHEQKKSKEKVTAERQAALIKILSAVLIGIIGLSGGYIANSCAESKNTPSTGAVEIPHQEK